MQGRPLLPSIVTESKPLTLPEREKNDTFDAEELEHWIVFREKLASGHVEQHQAIQ